MEGFLKTVIIFVVLLVFCERFPFSEERSSFVNVTLTTAKRRGSASPKPTSNLLKRRVNFDQQLRSAVVGVDGLETLRPHDRDSERNKVDNVWDWDFWCQLQPKTGKCPGSAENRRSMTRNYYYDALLDACKPFKFSGCDGNKNNFQTLVDCERYCKDSVYMTLKESANTSYCALQPNAGSCMALLQRYYYDVRAGECKIFTYGGCGGNQNRFETSTLCNKRCKPEE